MKNDYDVAIVGAGPIGGSIGNELAEKKFKVAIFEQKKQVGEPLKCAGLVTSRVFNHVNVSKSSIVQNEIKGAKIHSPSDYVLTIGGNRTHALVIDRIKFDKEIIKKAKRNGADVFLENKIISAKKNEQSMELISQDKKNYKCKLLIGADGPHSNIRNIFSLPHPKEFVNGIGAEVSGVNLNPDFVEIFIGNHLSPGFFAWMIPTDKQGTKARIGLCIKPNLAYSPKYYFDNFLKNKNLSKYFEDIKITKKIGGSVPFGPIKKTYKSNLMIVGDAAAQVKPTSGGGIYTGLLCGQCCSEIAIKAMEKNNFSEVFLKKYHKLWTSKIGSELNRGMKFRKIFKSLSDKQMDEYILKFQNHEIVEIINKYGDIDYPSELMKPLLKKAPSLLKLIPKLIR